MLGASFFFLGKKSPKGNILFFETIFCSKYSFSKHIKKIINYFFEESIAIVIITTKYSFEETSKNMSQEWFLIV
jgi:hypothetical protein